MQMYILSLLTLLVIITLGAVYYLNRQLNFLKIKVNNNSYDISNIQKSMDGSLNNIFSNVNEVDLMKDFVVNDDDDDEVDDLETDDDDDEVVEDDDEVVEDDDDEVVEDDDDEVVEDDDDEDNEDDDVVEVVDDDKVEDVVEDVVENVVENVSLDLTDGGNFVIKEESPSKKKKKNTPETAAKQFDVGYVCVSENDSNKYEVMADKNGNKRWRKLKEE